jgi:hypothetical protein
MRVATAQQSPTLPNGISPGQSRYGPDALLGRLVLWQSELYYDI